MVSVLELGPHGDTMASLHAGCLSSQGCKMCSRLRRLCDNDRASMKPGKGETDPDNVHPALSKDEGHVKRGHKYSSY